MPLRPLKRLLGFFNKSPRREPMPPGHSLGLEQTVAFASDLCIGPNRKPVRYMRRDDCSLTLKNHTRWILFSGEESAEEFRDPSRFKRVFLPSFIREDTSLAPLVDSPVGAEWTRSKAENIWRRIVNDQVIDDDGKVIGAPHEIYVRSKPESA
jgi:hypothetical protein